MADSHNTQGQYLRLKPTSLIKGIRKEPDYEKSSQQKQIRQAAVILVFPILTPSLPRCHLKATNKTAKFETFFVFSFALACVFLSERIALKVDAL